MEATTGPSGDWVRSNCPRRRRRRRRQRGRRHQSRGRTRSRQLHRHNPRVKSVGLGPHAAVWPPSLGCPLGRSLPRLPMVWRGLARGCALLPRWWSAPAAPSCRGSRFDSSCRGRGRGSAPPAAGIRPRAESPRRQPADAVAADAATPPPTPPPPPTTTTSTPSPPRPSPSPPPPAMESIECTAEPC